MFKRSEVFAESFLPQSLPGRSDQLDALQGLLYPTIQGDPAELCWELGGSGVGKTTTARWLLEDLRVNHAIDWTRVECVGASRWELLGEICGDHPNIAHHQGMGTDQMVRELTQNVDRPYIVVLDEIDGLEDERVLVDLENVRLCSVLCIGHDEESALATVPESAQHLRHAEILEFDPYSVDAMLDILEARVETGLEPGVIDDDQLTRIANEAAGSARYGVQSLRSAVELGQQRNHTSVQKEDIDEAFEHAKNRIREQLLASLSRQHHIVYQIIRDAGDAGIRPPELLEVYRDRVPDPRSRQQVTTYREKLERYDLIEGDDDASRWTCYTAVDDTLKAPLRERPV